MTSVPMLFVESGSARQTGGPSKSGPSEATEVPILLDPSAVDSLATDGPVELRLPLFGGDIVVARLDRFQASGAHEVVRAGTIAGFEGSSVVFVQGEDVFYGAIHLPERGDFQIRGDGEGATLRMVDRSQMETTCRLVHDDGSGRPEARGASYCPTLNSPLAGYAADSNVVDVMVYYTPAARTAAGGDAAISAQIDMAAATTNTILTNSLINMQVRIIRKALISYTEVPDAVTNLDRLVNPSDGFLDIVHAERDLYGADLVSLWVGNTINAGGVAYEPFAQNPDEDGRYSFSVMRQDNYSFETLAHELGHNFGCNHDRCNQSGVGFFNYSYGYRQPCDGAPPPPCTALPCTPFRDIMAYPPGTVAFYYSNPSIIVGGKPLGGNDEFGMPCNNALSINQLAFTLANIRPSTVTPAPAARVYVNAAASPGGSGASWATAMKDLQDGIGLAVRARGVVTEVWVAQGTYKPDRGSNDRLRCFRPVNGVAIYGGFIGTETQLSQRDPVAHPTILSGEIGTAATTDNSYHVLRCDQMSATAVLDGFRITAGRSDGAYPHNSGGGMLSRCSTPTIRNCVFDNNYAAYIGGGAYNDHAGGVFTSCTFSNNTAQYGAGLDNYLGTAQFNTCTFSTNTASQFGGGAQCQLGTVSFTGCAFNGNHALYGAGLRSTECNTNSTSCAFTGNVATNGGGGAYSDSCSPSFSQCQFTSNSAGWGGGIDNYQANATVTACTFTTNMSSGDGGGALNEVGSTVVYSDCTFNGNTASYGAGLEDIQSVNTSLTRCMFLNNTAVNDGGGVYHYNNPATDQSCTFQNNHATNGGGGGLTSAENANVLVRDCDFISNTSGFLGGGAGTSNAVVRFGRCRFTGNQSTYGAGAHNNTGSDTKYVACNFTGNTASWSGGGVESYQIVGSIFASCIFNGNRAVGSHGGGLSNVGGSNVTATNCTIVSNTAGCCGGGIAVDAPQPVLVNSILWNNSDSSGTGEISQIRHFSGATQVSYSTIQNWSGALGGTGNNGSNPLFIDIDGPDNIIGNADDILRFVAPSPCIDSGNNAAIPADFVDLDGDSNTAEQQPLDIAGNPRRYDDPAVANTGPGSPPHVDRGAFEAVPSFCGTGDYDHNFLVNTADLALFVSDLVSHAPNGACEGDMNADSKTDGRDIRQFISAIVH